MSSKVVFEQRWPIDEDALRRTRKRWVAVFTPLSLVGIGVMVAQHGADPAKTGAAFALLLGIGYAGSYLWALTAHIRRQTRLVVTSDGSLHVSAFPRRTGTFDLRRCREVALKQVVDHDAGPTRVYRYDLVVKDRDRELEFVLPGRIGSTGNWSTFSDAEAAAFHAAVARFTQISSS